MGPQPLGHGYGIEYPAVSMGPQPLGHGYPKIPKFQWGHNLSVMDTNGSDERISMEADAVSMGPQPLGHGYEVSGSPRPPRCSTIPGAHWKQVWSTIPRTQGDGEPLGHGCRTR